MASTNETAVAVQSGQADILELWFAVRRFAIKQGLRWLQASDGKGGVTIDDLEQSAFLALLDALEDWNASEGSFISWYALRLKTAFESAMGLRTQRDRKDPIRSALSLDKPLTDREGDPFTIADIVPDPAAEAAFADIEWRELQRVVQTALAQLTDTQRAAIIGEFWLGQKCPYRLLQHKGLRYSRRDRLLPRSCREYAAQYLLPSSGAAKFLQ